MKTSCFVVVLSIALGGCANLVMGWYKPGGSQMDFAQDKYQCMASSQERVSGAYVNASGGAASSGTTTNMPLFQACMEARGYVWTSQAQVNQYEEGQTEAAAPQQAIAPDEDQHPDDGSAGADSAQPGKNEYDSPPSLEKQADTAGVAISAYTMAYEHCMQVRKKEIDCEFLTKDEVDDFNRGINPDL